MAVDVNTGPSNVDLNSLIKGVDMGNLLGNTNNGSDGLGGGVLLGLLLGRSGILGGTEGAAAAIAAKTLDSSDVQGIVQGALNSQSLGNVEGEIWKAEGQLQAALQAQSSVQQIATLNSEIANLQAQGVLVKAVTEGAALNAEQHGAVIAATQSVGSNIVNVVNAGNATLASAINTGTASLLSTTNALASQAATNANAAALATLQAKYDTLVAIDSDGDQTRAAIAALGLSIPNARELDLQRQLAVALDDHRHTATRGVIDSGNVNVTTNVAQSQAQLQAQQQAFTTNGLLGQLIAAQHATNSAVTIGNGNRPTQTATNVGG